MCMSYRGQFCSVDDLDGRASTSYDLKVPFQVVASDYDISDQIFNCLKVNPPGATSQSHHDLCRSVNPYSWVARVSDVVPQMVGLHGP